MRKKRMKKKKMKKKKMRKKKMKKKKMRKKKIYRYHQINMVGYFLKVVGRREMFGNL